MSNRVVSPLHLIYLSFFLFLHRYADDVQPKDPRDDIAAEAPVMMETVVNKEPPATSDKAEYNATKVFTMMETVNKEPLATIDEAEPEDSKPSAKRKAKSVAQRSAKKAKGSAKKGTGSVKKTKKFQNIEDDLSFSFHIPGVYTKKGIWHIDERLPGQKWDFNHVVLTIAELDYQLKEEDIANGDQPKTRKYRIVGHRNKEVVAPREIGIKAAMNDHSGTHIPYVSVHAFVKGDIDRVVDSVESKFETVMRFYDIGNTYTWKDIECEGLDIKMLVAHWRDSSRAASEMSDEDKSFFASAHVWLPKPFDANNANPFRAVLLEFEESELEEPSELDKERALEGEELRRAKGDNATFIPDDYFKDARKKLLADQLQIRLQQDPNFCSEEEDGKKRLRKQKQIIWNEMLLEPHMEVWSESMLKMVDKLLELEELQDDLDIVVLPEEEIRARLVEASKHSFAKFHPQMVQELDQYEGMRDIVQSAKHFKIYPNNKVLHHSFLHRDNRQINEMLGKAEAVFPTATMQMQVPAVWKKSNGEATESN